MLPNDIRYTFSAQLINELEHTVTQSENQGLIERFRSIKEEMEAKEAPMQHFIDG